LRINEGEKRRIKEGKKRNREKHGSNSEWYKVVIGIMGMIDTRRIQAHC